MRPKRSDGLVCEELEPRLLLSADLAVGIAADLTTDDASQAETDVDLQAIETELLTQSPLEEDETNQSTRELVIIDSAVSDYESVLDDLVNHSGDARSFEIVLLDSNENGVDQLSEILSEYRDLDAIHLISHGDDAAIHLGNIDLDLQQLEKSADQISAWGASLKSEGDWLIYACDVASTSIGESFIDKFSLLTGADVAASNDLTGNVTLSGDWDLEYASGTIETGLALSEGFQVSYAYSLDITTGLLGYWDFDGDATDSSGNNYDGSLSNGALIDTNTSTNIVGGGKLSTDGVNDYVDLSSHVGAFSGLTQGTVATWINTTSSSSQYIFSIYDSSMSSDVNIGVSNGKFFYYAQNWDAGILLNVSANTTINDGAWHHVAFTVDATGNSLYIDGVRVSLSELTYAVGSESSSVFFNSIDFIDDMQIGAIDDSLSGIVNPYSGLVDELRIYDRALTATDIEELANLAPTIDSAGMTLVEGETVTITSANFSVSDPDDTTFTYNLSGVNGGYFQLSNNPASPIASFTSADLTAGIVQFVDNGDESAPSFTVSVNDGFVNSNSLSASVSYTDVNDAPVNILPASLSINEDTLLSFTGINQIQISDVDNAGGIMHIALNVDAGGLLSLGNSTGLTFVSGDGVDDANMVFTGTLSDINAALLTLTFSPTNNYNGNVNLTITTNDRGNSGIDPGLTGSATSEVDSDTIVIAVTPVNDTPLANADSISVTEGAGVTSLVSGAANLLSNDTGLGDAPVTVSLVTDVNYGSLTLNSDGTFLYAHDGSENFIDSFTYRITDNDGQTSDATVSINITPVSDTTPTAVVDSINISEGGVATTLVSGSATLLDNDIGLNDVPVTVSLVTDVNYGSLTLNSDGTFNYIHDGSENLADSFTYRLTDNDGQTSDATVTINITPVSDTTPLAVEDSITVSEGGMATALDSGSATLLGNDTGLNDQPVTVSLVTDVSYGSLTLNSDGTFNYIHDGSESFTDSFTYRITDNDGQTSDAIVSINITPVSDSMPVGNTDSISVVEGGSTNTLVGGFATVLNNDGGLADAPISVSLASDVSHGTLLLNADGTFIYTHDGSENHSDSFTYQITDNDGETAQATVNIVVTPSNDSPSITSHGGNSDVVLLLDENQLSVTTVDATDPDLDSLTYTIDGGLDGGLFGINGATGDLFFLHAPDSEQPGDSNQDNVYLVEVRVADGNGGVDRQAFSVQITDVDEFDVGMVMDVDNTPDQVTPLSQMNDQVGITVTAEDPDSGNSLITYSLDDDAEGLFAIDAASGVVTLASSLPENNTAGFDITVRASSEDGSFSLHTYNIAFTSIDDSQPETVAPYLDEVIPDLDLTSPDVFTQPETPMIEEGVNELNQLEENRDQISPDLDVMLDGEEQDEADSLFRQVQPGFEDTDNRSIYCLQDGITKLTPNELSPDQLPDFNTSSNNHIEVPETLWNLLDAMNQDMSDSQGENSESDGLILQSAAVGTLTVSAGYVAWLLRAGVLSTSLLTSAPLWRQVDPLPVLSARAKQRESEKINETVDDPNERRISKLFDKNKRQRLQKDNSRIVR